MFALAAATPALPSSPYPPPSSSCGHRTAGDALAFGLFLWANAVLFIRPTEIVPGLIGWPLFQVLILACLVLSLGGVLARLTSPPLVAQPITICVLGLLPLAILSQLGNASMSGAVAAGSELCKIVVYYLLLITLVNSPDRLRRFLRWYTVFLLVPVTLAVLVYHGVVTLPNLTTLHEGYQDASGRELSAARLRGSGLFGDPNEICLLLVSGIALSCFGVGERRSPWRWLWLLPLGLFVYALGLTQSRGGMLAFLAAVLVYLWARFGKARALLLGALALPVLFALYAGRQTNISTVAGTAHDRIEIWSDGLMLLRHSPLFGVGMNQFSEHVGLVAHNSFLHAFSELGVLGGAFFLGAFYLCLRGLGRLNARPESILDPELGRLGPYLTAAVVGYTIGMMSVSYCYAMPTYTTIGATVVFLRVVPISPSAVPERFDARLLARLLGASALFLLGLSVFVRFSK